MISTPHVASVQCSKCTVILSSVASKARTVVCDLNGRVLVRSRPFWVKGLSNAWHSRDGVSSELVDAYRLPQLVRGWEIGLVRFIRAQVAGKEIGSQWILLLLPHCSRAGPANMFQLHLVFRKTAFALYLVLNLAACNVHWKGLTCH